MQKTGGTIAQDRAIMGMGLAVLGTGAAIQVFVFGMAYSTAGNATTALQGLPGVTSPLGYFVAATATVVAYLLVLVVGWSVLRSGRKSLRVRAVTGGDRAAFAAGIALIGFGVALKVLLFLSILNLTANPTALLPRGDHAPAATGLPTGPGTPGGLGLDAILGFAGPAIVTVGLRFVALAAAASLVRAGHTLLRGRGAEPVPEANPSEPLRTPIETGGKSARDSEVAPPEARVLPPPPPPEDDEG